MKKDSPQKKIATNVHNSDGVKHNTTTRGEKRKGKILKINPWISLTGGQILIKDQFEEREHYCREMR